MSARGTASYEREQVRQFLIAGIERRAALLTEKQRAFLQKCYGPGKTLQDQPEIALIDLGALIERTLPKDSP